MLVTVGVAVYHHVLVWWCLLQLSLVSMHWIIIVCFFYHETVCVNTFATHFHVISYRRVLHWFSFLIVCKLLFICCCYNNIFDLEWICSCSYHTSLLQCNKRIACSTFTRANFCHHKSQIITHCTYVYYCAVLVLIINTYLVFIFYKHACVVKLVLSGSWT